MNQTIPAQKILVVLPSPMGDAILCTPALRRLRQALPGREITFLGGKVVNEVLAGNPWADAMLGWEKKQTRGLQLIATARWLARYDFDGAILLSNSFRSGLLVRLAGIGVRIGYGRDGRGFLLSHPIAPFRRQGRFVPISMMDYYGYLAHRAIELLGGTVTAGAEPDDHRLELFTSQSDGQEVDTLLKKWSPANDKPPVALVPGGAFGASKWWPAERFAQLADRLSRDGYEVIISCAPNDAERTIARQIIDHSETPLYNLAEERLSLGGLKELLRRCRLIVANDTGPCHIAAAWGVPLVTLFGPTDPRWTATGYEKEIRLRVEVDCGPCQKGQCTQDHRCLTGITVEEVYRAARQLLDGRSGGYDAKRVYDDQRAEQHLPGQRYRPFEERFVPLRDGSGLVHGEYVRRLGQAHLGSLDEVFRFDQGQRLDKPGLRHRQRLRVSLPLSDDNQGTLNQSGQAGAQTVIYIKRYGRPGLWERAKRRLVQGTLSAAENDFANTVTLAEKGVAVPRPVAYGQEFDRWGEKRSFVMIEELPQADALERILPAYKQKQQQYRLLQDRKLLVRQIAILVRQLHQKGYFHRDLYLSHIFLSKNDDGTEQLSLIDLQRVFRPQWGKRRWQVKDLAQLYYSGRGFFGRSELLRFLHEYLQCSQLQTEHKRLIRAIVRKAQRIARHDRQRQIKENCPS